MIDCGHNSSTGWRPSQWVRANGGWITNLTVSNTDEDHVSDLPNLYRDCRIGSLSTNWHIDSGWIRRAKIQSGMGPGVSTLVQMTESYTGPPLQTNWGGATVSRFCLQPYTFNDENSLSLVTFIHYGIIRMIFPGDLTVAAWRALLNNHDFVRLLGETNIFMASHHGRTDGYCTEVFRYCTPEIIIISDKGIEHDTQNVNYSQHARGITWNNNAIKRVLTTRTNGKIELSLQPNGRVWITAVSG